LVARAFEGLAGHTDTIVSLAAAIVGCVENENVSSVLPQVQTLGAAARVFIGDRLQATTGILETVTTEVKLLRQLSRVAGDQEAIAFEIKALSVLTNIEVARLGTVGAGFHYLAQELANFSKSVIEDTKELARHTDGRRAAIEETRRVLSAELPRLREELARIEVELGNALAVVDASLTQLSSTPVQLRTCVEDIARQIAGVVAAVQTHDITRQQIEHVQAAFALIWRMASFRNCLGPTPALPSRFIS
jgi:chromosome segregation ATPase